MDNILITGNLGYLGSNFIKMRTVNKYDMIMYDISQNDIFENKYKCDILNMELLEKYFLKFKPIMIIHFADIENENCKDAFRTNVIGTLNILKLMVKYDCKKIIFKSTDKVYESKFILLDTLKENDHVILSSKSRSQIPYGIQKILCENVIEYFCEKYSINCNIIRFCNVLGGLHKFDDEFIINIMLGISDINYENLYDVISIKDAVIAIDNCMLDLLLHDDKFKIICLTSGKIITETYLKLLLKNTLFVNHKFNYKIKFEKLRTVSYSRIFSNRNIYKKCVFNFREYESDYISYLKNTINNIFLVNF